MTNISESELILPTLHLLYLHKNLSTSDLIPLLRNLLKPDGNDLTILKNRKDDKFSQKVRNLKAHKTLTRKGFVIEIIKNKKTYYDLSTKGLDFYNTKKYSLKNLFQFPFNDTKDILSKLIDQEITVLDENILITEGDIIKKNSFYKKRSLSLRQHAIEYYSKNGNISCHACNFDFKKFYGSIAKNYIEIHHIKPIYQYKRKTTFNLEKALDNLLPLCANCHRVTHLYTPPLSINKLKNITGFL